jgi:hypothetical protein
LAVKTLGTNANNSITNAIAFLPGYGQIANADVATIALAIKDDQNVSHPVIPGSFNVTEGGQLFIPNRGVLRVLAGDWVGVDSRGWPILLSKDTIANGPWTHS